MEACPFRDYAGQKIVEGDRIIHPSGQSGVVIFHADREAAEDQWVVKYEQGGFESRLCLQIGDRGRAIVESKGVR